MKNSFLKRVDDVKRAVLKGKNRDSSRRLLQGLAGLLLCLATLAQAAEQPRIEGIIMDSKGRPLPNASVYVYTAKPREGDAAMCPTCYPECGKKVRTDEQGHFNIEPVNGDLLYRLLVTAKGWRADYITDADPLFGSVETRLKAHRWMDAPLERKVIGKIIDPEGKPVPGAILNVDGYRDGRYSSYGAAKGKAETYSATDENGEFLITCTNGMLAVNATVEARGLAKRKIWLDTGKAHLLRMKHGVEVSGRLLKDGNPISGVNVSMTMQEREAGVSMRGFDGTTGTDGRFTIPNVPANMRFYLSTKIKDMAKLGVALSPQLVSTGADESVSKVGDLTVRPAYTMRGKVVVADGQPLPPNTRLYLGLENGADGQQITVKDDGTFEFKGLPADAVSLSLRVKDYRISAKNPNKDWLNEGMIVGRLQGDMENFIIHLEKGERFERDSAPPDSGDAQPRGKLLRGAKL